MLSLQVSYVEKRCQAKCYVQLELAVFKLRGLDLPVFFFYQIS